MQLFMWQQDIVGVAHYIMDCLMPLVHCLMLLMPHQPHLYRPWRLDRSSTIDVIQSLSTVGHHTDMEGFLMIEMFL